MTDETDKKIEEQDKKIEEMKQKENAEIIALEKADRIETEIYEERKKRLAEIESKLDQKMDEFKKLVEDAERQGISYGGRQQPKTPEQEAEEKAINDLNQFS